MWSWRGWRSDQRSEQSCWKSGWWRSQEPADAAGGRPAQCAEAAQWWWSSQWDAPTVSERWAAVEALGHRDDGSAESHAAGDAGPVGLRWGKGSDRTRSKHKKFTSYMDTVQKLMQKYST